MNLRVFPGLFIVFAFALLGLALKGSMTGYAVAIPAISGDAAFITLGFVAIIIVTLTFIRLDRQPPDELKLLNVHQGSEDWDLLEKYIDYSLHSGKSKAYLRKNLLNAGWDKDMVDRFLGLH